MGGIRKGIYRVVEAIDTLLVSIYAASLMKHPDYDSYIPFGRLNPTPGIDELGG